MSSPSDSPVDGEARAHEIFKTAKPEYQGLIRDILKEEREVMHLKRRSDIHHSLYELIRRAIK